jgi:hypothetical protein
LILFCGAGGRRWPKAEATPPATATGPSGAPVAAGDEPGRRFLTHCGFYAERRSAACANPPRTRPHDISAPRFLRGRSRLISAGFLSRPSLPRTKPLEQLLAITPVFSVAIVLTLRRGMAPRCAVACGALPREPTAASGQAYPELQRNLLDERYIHEVTASGDVSGVFAVSERANPERRDRYARARRS